MSEQNPYCITTLYIYYNEDENKLKFAHCCMDRGTVDLGQLTVNEFYNMSDTDFCEYLESIALTKSHKCGLSDKTCDYFWKKNNYKIDTLSVSISKQCNLNCPMCYIKTGHIDTPKRKQLYLDVIRKLKDLDFNRLKLTDWGEPLIYINDIIPITNTYKYCKNLTIVTNGTLLNPNTLCLLINSFNHLFIEVDCDSLIKANYEKIRENANFEKTFQNLINCVSIYKENKNKIFLQFHCVKQSFNENEIDNIKRFAKRLGIPICVVKQNYYESDIWYH